MLTIHFVPSCKGTLIRGCLYRVLKAFLRLHKNPSSAYSFNMNFVFTLILCASVLCLIFISPDSVLSSLIEGTGNGLTFAVKLFAVYGVWLSVLKIWEKLNFDKFCARKSIGLLKKFFPGENDSCYADLSVNLSANFLGMGSAGTPAGINACKKMISPKNKTMLIVINSTSIQLIPTTIVAIRTAHSASSDIILPTLISTFLSTFIGIVMVKIFVKNNK